MSGYRDGVQDLGNGLYAYMQDCNQGFGWGWSNSGLITDHEESLLIDTLRDEKLTVKMLAAYRDATGLSARDIATLVNTHRDADHTFGNRLMEHARIIASDACKQGMAELTPQLMRRLFDNRPEGVVGDFLFNLLGPPFDFDDVEHVLPNDTFTGRRDLKVGDKDVHLIEVGPAHTGGDILVHVPSDRMVFTGDIVFLTNTPIIWSGPHENWLAALDELLAMDVDMIVPGHGPVTDKTGVMKVKQYLEHVEREARARFDAGMELHEAIQDISLGEFDDWGGAERIVTNVLYFYRRFGGDPTPINIPEAFAMMAPYAMRGRKGTSPSATAPAPAKCCPH
ncbi:MBL fold metallo-hydrolase [uncultured Sphingomonas sp.]|uniref:MBL fold metallo-hydrolase n=1 Tax=uncultured Sphingomonas sp. TaxID=158754 RepID=UPI0035C9E8D5